MRRAPAVAAKVIGRAAIRRIDVTSSTGSEAPAPRAIAAVPPAASAYLAP